MAEHLKPKRGLPKRVGRAGHKARHKRYLERSTCTICKIVFRSPKLRLRHKESGHKDNTGRNPRRSVT